jgi:hypothetical protein
VTYKDEKPVPLTVQFRLNCYFKKRALVPKTHLRLQAQYYPQHSTTVVAGQTVQSRLDYILMALVVNDK